MELKAGDYVVHEQHGIGRFLEMRQRTIGAGANQTTREYLVIEYASSKRGAPADKLFIPTDQLDQVSKYIGADAPKLNKLGGSDWAATKAKARKHVHEIAEDLVKLYSARQRMQGYAFSKDTPWQKELEDAFPYQETADQLTTIDEVKSDMEARADGSPDLRRRGIRQNRNRRTCRIQGGAGFQTGGCAGADHIAGATAFRDVHRTF